GRTTAGLGSSAIPFNFAGALANLSMSSFGVTFNNELVSKPTSSVSGTPPGHLASERVDPALTSFSAGTTGSMCGAVSAASLAQVQLPPIFTSLAECAEGYSPANTLLDLLVGGCTQLSGVQIRATQPDTFDPSVATSGTYRFLSIAEHQVTSCTKDGVAATLSDCLAGAAY
ncbi:MAG TPA: hypothetical protein VEU08_04450, partial [Vicinamibacterales bacterium]|nr:hypothetical protein [Vicinamibacterales bacterium]